MFEQISGDDRLSVSPLSTVNNTSNSVTDDAESVSIVTLALIGINCLVFLAMLMAGLSPLDPLPRDVLRWGANFGPATIYGQSWRLFTACFVHFGIVHLAMNMYILFQVGLFTEKLFGRARFALLYLLAGLGGSVVSLYVRPLRVSAGASGAIFGVYGALLGFLLIKRKTFPAAAAQQIALRSAFILAINLVYGLTSSRVDISAHLGGLVTGFVAGCMLARPHASGSRRLPLGRTIATGVGGFGLLAASLAFMPKINAEEASWYREIIAGTEITAPNKGHLIYGGTSTKGDAERLSHALEKEGFFKGSGHLVLLVRDASGTSISISVGKDESTYLPIHGKTSKLVNGQTVTYPYDEPAPLFPWNDPKILASFRMIGTSVASSVGGIPIKMLLLNNKGELRKAIEIDQHELRIGTLDKVWFDGTATQENALALGKALQNVGLFRDQGALAVLSRGASGTDLSILVSDGAWNKPTVSAGLQTIARKVASSVGGLPITLHVIDPAFQAQKTFVVQ